MAINAHARAEYAIEYTQNTCHNERLWETIDVPVLRHTIVE
jgi:hypothetical protein